MDAPALKLLAKWHGGQLNRLQRLASRVAKIS